MTEQQQLLRDVLATEKAKWVQRNYREWLALNPTLESPYFYSVRSETCKFEIELELLETEDDYVHPAIQVSDPFSWRRFFWFLCRRDSVMDDWIVYADGRVDA